MNPNIKYELLELEKLILIDSQNADHDSPQFTRLKENAFKEVERVKQTFIHEVFSFEDEHHLERYIQYHQQALIRLMDKVVSRNPLFQTSTNRQKDQSDFYKCLEELLDFVERHFAKYFDQDAKAPQGYIDIARHDTRTNLKKIQRGLIQVNADPKIIDLIVYVLEKMEQGKHEKGITYRKVMYAKEVQKELFRLLENKSSVQDINEDLRHAMYYLNYNATKVLTYHAHYISSVLEQIETRAEKIEKLSFLLKKINQAQVKPGIRYNTHAPSLKEQLNAYLTEEIEYMERLQQLSAPGSHRPDDNLFSGFKLKFEASVSQLAYLLKVFVETKVILNNNLTQVLQFIVRFAITKKSESISYSSLRSKFYNVENGTKESVRQMLSLMIQYIDRT
jgi:hypothetical protein